MTIRSGDRAIAVRRLSIPKDQELAVLSATMQRGELLHGVAERARQLGHEIVRWVAHDQESIAMCPRCQARLYVRLDAVPPWWTVRRSITSARADRGAQSSPCEKRPVAAGPVTGRRDAIDRRRLDLLSRVDMARPPQPG